MQGFQAFEIFLYADHAAFWSDHATANMLDAVFEDGDVLLLLSSIFSASREVCEDVLCVLQVLRHDVR